MIVADNGSSWYITGPPTLVERRYLNQRDGFPQRIPKP